MLYTVHTSYRVFDAHTGHVRGFSQTDKVDCPDKETAKTYCWKRILDEYQGYCDFVAQNARATTRKESSTWKSKSE